MILNSFIRFHFSLHIPSNELAPNLNGLSIIKIALNSQFSKLETTVLNPFIRIVSFIYIWNKNEHLNGYMFKIQRTVLSVQCSNNDLKFKLIASVTVSFKIQMESIYT